MNGFFWVRLIVACIPLIGTVSLFVLMAVKMKKRAEGIAVGKFAIMRAPTEDEADLIRRQVAPRNRTKIITICLIFVPLCLIVTVMYVKYAVPGNLFQIIGAGLLVFGVYAMWLGMLSAPLSDMNSLRKGRYTVSDCRISEIRVTYHERSTTINPIELRSAIVKDDEGYIWEAPLPKDLREISEGTKCLIVIYDIEDEINRAKSGTMPVYRRELIVL